MAQNVYDTVKSIIKTQGRLSDVDVDNFMLTLRVSLKLIQSTVETEWAFLCLWRLHYGTECI